MNHLQDFFHVRPAERDHIPAFRIALGVAVPLLTLLAIGRLDLAIYAAFGAFTSTPGTSPLARASCASRSPARYSRSACSSAQC